MAATLNITEKQVRTTLESLKSKGYIHRIDPDKGGEWLIDRNKLDISDFIDQKHAKKIE